MSDSDYEELPDIPQSAPDTQQQDVQPTHPRRDTPPTHPRRETPPTDPQEDIQPNHPRRDTPPTHSQQDNPPVPRDNHADTPRGEVTSCVLLQVSRVSIVPELLDHFKESYDDQDVQVEVMGEQAVDDNRVFRDVLTVFWNGVIGRFFEGEIQSVPVLSPSVSSEMWRAMGNILIAGFRQVGYLPPQLCLASLIYGIFGYVPRDILLQSWLETLGGFDKLLMTKVLAGDYEEEDLSDVIEIFDRFKVSENPTRDNVARLSERCANLMCVERPFYALLQMRLNRLQNFITTLPRLISIVHGIRPDGRKLSTMIRTEASNTQQERILRFLRQAIRGMEQNMLRRFLRFICGSDVINFSEINVNFVHLYGLQRRIVSHTCSVTLDVPLQYESYNDFSTELKNQLKNQLSSDVWEMDYA